MVSKSNQWQHLRTSAQLVPHYGLRKLSVGVASVLLSTTLYMGVNAHADTVALPNETTTSSTTMVTNQSLSSTETTSNVAGSSTNSVSAKPVSQAPTDQITPGNTGAMPEKLGDNAVDTKSGREMLAPVMLNLAAVKPATAWQSEPTTNYSADHTAKIDMTNQPTTIQGDNWQMTLDKNYIKAGQSATLTVNYEAQAGDTFVLDIGYPAGVNAQPLSSQIGTTSTKDNGLRTQVINVFKQAGTYTQTIKLNGWKSSAEGLELLRHVFGDQTFDLTLKHGTSVENAQDVGRLYLTSSFTPTMTGIGSVGVDRIEAKYVPVLSTNNNYIFTVRTNWSDSGTVLDPSYNGDFVYSVSVPKTFELDQTATEAFYQQIQNNELYYRWGIRGSNVTVSQAGVGAPVVIKANALDWLGWHYAGNEGVSFLGHFVDAPSVATTVTSEGQTTVSDTIGGHTQTITLPGLSAKVINATNYNYADSEATVFSMSDYGDHNQLYQSHEVPMTGNGNSINLINDLSLVNNSPFDVKSATITLTFGDGLHVDVDSVRNNSYISNLLADNYTHPNREKSLLVTYQDGTREMVPANSKGDPNKNIKSITLTRDWNAGQMAGMHDGGIRGFVAKTYQDGSPVKVGDTINVSLTVSGVNTAGHNVSKTVHDTLKVVDQQFAPLTTESFWGGIDKKGLGDDPSGTINLHWKRISGERGKIQLENPTLYFVMPNTVSQVKNPRWGSGKDAPGNAAPKLTSITYEKSKDGKNMVAIMHFSGTLIDQVLNNSVPLYFSTVNKDNVVNQASEGYLYWTADNVNANGLTKVDPTHADSQNKVGHLPADLTQEQLNKIYLHSVYWGSINMATGMYSTSATKTATTPWQTQTIVDYHGDGQADVGVNLVNDTSNELHNVVAIINLPKASNDSNLTVNLTGNKVELIDTNTNSKLTDDVTVLYSMKSADLSSNDLSSFVTADQIEDWSKVQAVAVILPNLGGMTSRQVQIPVVVNDLVANAGKAGTIGTRISANELKPIIVSADAENAAKLVVGGQATIHVQMHYQDAQGKDHYVPLTNPTHAYDILQHHVLNSSDFTPSTTDLAQIPGYELSKTSPTIISGKAVIGQPVSAQDDDSVLQFELVPSAQKVLINYVDDDDNQKVIKADTLTGKTGETQQINVVTPDNYVLVNSDANPSEYTFLASDNKPIIIHFTHAHQNVTHNYTVTRTINYVDANGTHLKPSTVQNLTFTRTGVQDMITKKIIWNATPVQSFATVNDLNILGYQTDTISVPELTANWNDQNSTVDVHYQALNSTVTVNFVDAMGHVIAATPVAGQVGSTVDLAAQVPDGWVTYNTDIPTRVVIENHPASINYLIAHRLAFVKPTDGVKVGDLIPGTKSKTFNDKINANNLVTHASYTANIWVDEAHTRKLFTKTYHAVFTRNAVVDAVTGDVYYSTWSEGGKYVFAGFTRQVSDGYQAVVVPSWTATQANPVKTIDLVAQPQQLSGTIRYQTADGKVVSTQAFTGSKAVTLTAPKGYTLMTNAATIMSALERDQTYTVYVRPTQILYTTADKLPAGMESLSKTITRTIHITEANGHVRTIKQVVHFIRTATVKADGSIEYSNWQATGRTVMNKLFLPKRHGYHIVMNGDLAKMNVTADMSNLVVNVRYVKD